MRRALLIVLIAAPLAARADTLRLKGNVSLTVTSVRDLGTQYEYFIGPIRYTIDKAQVESIERDATPMPAGADSVLAGRVEPKAPDPAAPAPDQSTAERGATLRHYTADELDAVAAKGDKSATARAYSEAARAELQGGDRTLAVSYFARAVELQPSSAPLLSWYVSALLQSGRASEALPHAQRMAELAPGQPAALNLLGLALYRAGQPEEALKPWKRSLELKPDDAVQKLVERAEREAAGESGFRQQETSRFVVRYEGHLDSELLGRDILATLEQHYNALAADLDLYPRETITIVIYGKRPFFDVTRAPAWSGGINNGTLRIPVDGLAGMTPELSRVLKHELAHSFLTLISYGRCPGWLHEGLAQLLEPADLAPRGRFLAAAFARGQQLPLAKLRGSFTALNAGQARLAYAESLATVEYIRSRYSMAALQQILKAIAAGSSAEEALQSVISLDYDQLEKSVAAYVAETYGK
jgi:Tfp pilus assembly protein PilF